jgi:signal transduction histidine kinase/ActR/RegA family two-component response regulator
MLKNDINLRLRTKFLLSLVLITACLTCATLLVVRRSAQMRVQREIQQEALNTVLTFEVVQHQHQVTLSRKADLLASVAFMRNGDATTIQDVSEDPWQSGECDLFVLADPSGKIVALHSTIPEFPIATAEQMLARSLQDGSTAGWWYSGSRLYQVVLQPFYDGAPLKGNLLGTVIVGRGIDPAANDLSRGSSSQVAFRYGSEIVASSLDASKARDLARELKAGKPQQELKMDGERFFASSVELTPGATPAVSIIVLKSYSEALAFLENLNHLLVALGLVAVLAGGMLGFAISDRFTRPLESLVEGVQALEKGDFAYPLEAHGGDEVAQVTRAFDRMRGTLKNNESERQQLEEQLRQSQKMEAMGRLAGGVAHDFNNLLTVIKGHSGLLLDRLQAPDSAHGSARQIDKAADRAASLTRQMLAFCRMQVLQPKVLDLNALVSEMSSLLRRLVREDIAFTLQAGESLGRVKADPGQIEQVIMNLTVNAGDAMPEGGKLTIETRNVVVDAQLARQRPPMQPGRYVLLAVVDTGHGMDPNTKARIFEPFFTTKEQGKGTGLGLATVYGVVKQSGGCIWVDSAPGKGARFEVYLPAVDEVEEIARPQETTVTPARRSETVLIVEDEAAVRELASEFMKSAGYTVLAAQDGEEALALVARSEEQIQILLTDVVMPNMRGPELAKRLKALHPDLKVVYMSGYLEFNVGGGEFLDEAFFLQKPFSRHTLVRKVAEALSNERVVANSRP